MVSYRRMHLHTSDIASSQRPGCLLHYIRVPVIYVSHLLTAYETAPHLGILLTIMQVYIAKHPHNTNLVCSV